MGSDPIKEKETRLAANDILSGVVPISDDVEYRALLYDCETGIYMACCGDSLLYDLRNFDYTNLMAIILAYGESRLPEARTREQSTRSC